MIILHGIFSYVPNQKHCFPRHNFSYLRFGRSVVFSPFAILQKLHLAEVYITNFSNDIFMER